MVKVCLSQLKPGMKIAKDVILPDGRLLLLSGFVIKPLYIRKLESFGIDSIYIEEDVIELTMVYEEEELYKSATATIKNIFTLLREGKSTSTAVVKETVNALLQKVMENEAVMLQLTGIRDIDNYTYMHSIDVCIYSVILGKKLGYEQGPLVELGMGAILHDIGKCKVPMEILQKPGKLTEDEFQEMKFHTLYGGEIIERVYGMNANIANIAYQHHERWDGSGYPAGLSGDKIDPFARIVALADVYDALTSDRVYKKKDLPHNAAEYVFRNSGKLFDPLIVELFINNVAVYAEGTIVLLNTGELGSVMASEEETGSFRQKINVFTNKSGPPVLSPYILDLNQHQDIDIVEVLM